MRVRGGRGGEGGGTGRFFADQTREGLTMLPDGNRTSVILQPAAAFGADDAALERGRSLISIKASEK